MGALERLAHNGVTGGATRELPGGCILGTVNSAVSFSDEGAGISCVLDGELYERSELAERLSATGRASSDAMLATQAYQQFGDTFPDALWGEFSFALWDARRRRLVLGRDAMGRSPLFYARANDVLAFASEPRGLRDWPRVDDRLNEEWVARELSLQFEASLTPFRGIHAVPAGSVLVVEDGRAPRCVRYWQPLSKPQLYARDPREYAEALRAAMLRAVEVRLPGDGVIASQLSSGFDSSAVTALAAQVLLRQNRPLLAYTSAPVHRVDAREILQRRFSDEWPLAAKAAAMYPNVEHIRVANDAAAWIESLDGMTDATGWPPGFLRNVRWYHRMHLEAKARGATVMLNGQAGNLVSSYDGTFGLFDLRARRQWLRLAAALLRRRGQSGTRWKQLVHDAWMPRAQMMAWINRARRRPVPDGLAASLMRAEFYRSTGLPALAVSPMASMPAGDRRDGAAWRLGNMQRIDLGLVYAGERRVYGMRRSDPTADRRLAELCLSIPDEAFAPKGKKRDLYRIALKDDLPAELLQEPMRGLQSSDFLQMFAEALPEWKSEADSLAANATVARILDVPRMRGMLDAFPSAAELETLPNRGELDLRYNYTFGGALAMGRWIRRTWR